MNRQGLIFLTLAACFCLTKGNVKAQTYNIESFDGINTKIKLYYKPLSNVLTISCQKDTIFLDGNFLTMEKVRLLNKFFLEITYHCTAGSDEDILNTMLICVDKNKLRQAMHVQSLLTYGIGEINPKTCHPNEYQLYKLTMQLIGNGKKNYKLNLIIHDETISKKEPKTNQNNDSRIALTFDPKQGVFYSAYENLSKTFAIYNPKTQSTLKKNIRGIIPVTKIDDVYYYYFEGEWYEKGNGDYLLKYAHK